MPKHMCEYLVSEKVQGHPIATIRQDNAGENKKACDTGSFEGLEA
jgi:hypothetical protein